MSGRRILYKNILREEFIQIKKYINKLDQLNSLFMFIKPIVKSMILTSWFITQINYLLPKDKI